MVRKRSASCAKTKHSSLSLSLCPNRSIGDRSRRGYHPDCLTVPRRSEVQSSHSRTYPNVGTFSSTKTSYSTEPKECQNHKSQYPDPTGGRRRFNFRSIEQGNPAIDTHFLPPLGHFRISNPISPNYSSTCRMFPTATTTTP